MRALIICTNHDNYPSKTGKTGVWLSELTHFYDIMTKRRIHIDIISPRGGQIPIDERSKDMRDQVNLAYWGNELFQKKLSNSLPPHQVHPEDYRIVYFAGGHGALWDLTSNKELENITRRIYENNGIVSAVSHGVCGLLNIRLSDNTPLIKDKYITGLSNIEETLQTFVSEVPFSLEDKLKENGAHYTKSMIPFIEFIELDERLITGQNPNSARKVACKAVEELFEK